MDQTQDVSGQQLYRLTRLYGMPDFVKNASVEEMCGDDKLPPHVFGDPRRRLFPCHSGSACWTSAVFFLDKQAEFKRGEAQLVWDRIVHCAKVFGVDKPVVELREKVAANVPSPESELPDEDFAIVLRREDGSCERHYALRNRDEVKAAASYLAEHRDSFPFDLRRQFADKVMQKAAQYGVGLAEHDDFITKQAGHGACSAKDAAEMLLGRFHASRTGPGPVTELQKGILKLAKMVAESPAKTREPGMLVKLAKTVDDFDRAAGLVGQYGPALPRPEDILFGLTREKMASVAKDHTHTITGNIYRLADLEHVKVADVEDLLGVDFAKELTSDGLRVDSEKAAAIIPTLPRGDAEMFDRLMAGVGVRPMAKAASAFSTGISREYLRELAAQRRK